MACLIVGKGIEIPHYAKVIVDKGIEIPHYGIVIYSSYI